MDCTLFSQPKITLSAEETRTLFFFNQLSRGFTKKQGLNV